MELELKNNKNSRGLLQVIFIKDINLGMPIFSDYKLRQIDGNVIINQTSPDIFNNINIFVGENNSGKSRLIRKLFETKEYFVLMNENGINYSERLSFFVQNFLNNVNITYNEYSEKAGEKTLYDPFQIKDTTVISSQEKYNLSRFSNKNIINDINDIKNLKKEYIYCRDKIINQLNGNVIEYIKDFGYKKIDEINSYLIDIEKIEKKAILRARYIPIIRGLKPLIQNGDLWDYENIFLNRVVFEYFTDKEGNKKETLAKLIFTGQDFYNKVKSKLLGTRADRDFINEYEKYLSQNFFDNKDVSILAREDKEIIYIRINEDEHPIFDLGDGIQSIIILTFEMFSNINNNMIFFIEEPETYLHPKYQRRLIDTFRREEFSTFQFFLTTHSNHLLDISSDYEKINIFALYPEQNELSKKFVIEIVSNDDFKPYELLGVRNSSLLLSNCTIWVEGITDRLYINKYLELYLNSEEWKDTIFKEDIHYSFIEYSGNNITHWSFLENENSINYKALTKKVFLIADNDNPKEGSSKSKRHEKLKESLNDNFYLLDSLEIENTLSLHVLKNTVAEIERKTLGNLVFSPDIKDDKTYRSVKLGKFLDDRISDKKIKFSDISGTIGIKIKFCKTALKYLTSYEDLSTEAKDLAKKLADFIKNSNS